MEVIPISGISLSPLAGSLIHRIFCSLDDVLRKHIGLRQHWRVTRAAPLHLRVTACRKALLVLDGDSLVVFADKIGRRDVAVGRAGELGELHHIRLRDKSRCP